MIDTTSDSKSSPTPVFKLKKTTDVDWKKANLNLMADIAEGRSEEEEESNNE